jgi:multidrug efflux pump subunit AcrB
MAASKTHGPIAWMAQNPVAGNVLMLILIIGGVIAFASSIKQEVFPTVELDVIRVTVPYRGASPAEVEQGVVLAIEEAVRGIDGVEEVRSVAYEGAASVNIQLLLGTDRRQALSDVKGAVGRITSFPADAERPNVNVVTNRQQVMSLVIHGEVDEAVLRAVAQGARRDLLQDERITSVELDGVRPLEISIEVSQANLRKHGLTLSGIAERVRAASVEVPGGALQTQGGEVLLRTTERRDDGQGFGDIVVLSRPDGSRVRVRDIAQVRDGFRENHQKATFNGETAAMIHVFRVGDQTPLEVAAAVKEHVAELEQDLPESLSVSTWFDRAEMYDDRIDLLVQNGMIGLVLVLLILGLFLHARLAFWVTLGIPVAFAGSLMLFPIGDVSINMISLFGFILALGMVVDDAIVVGEAIYKLRAEGKPHLEAAIEGVKEVAKPVVFSVVTTCVAFTPMLFVPGVAGKFFRVAPVVVIAVLMMSLVESLFILPSHLSHPMPWWLRKILLPYLWLMDRLARLDIANRFERRIHRSYVPILERALAWRYFTLAASIALLVATMGFAVGRIPMTFLPKIEGDLIAVQLRMYTGTPASETERIAHEVEKAAGVVMEAERANSTAMNGISRGVFTQTGALMSMGPGTSLPGPGKGAHLASVMAYLVDADDREITTEEFVLRWRRAVGEIAGIESMLFSYGDGIEVGQPIHVELMHDDVAVLEAAATRLARDIGVYSGLGDIESGVTRGKEQLDFQLTDAGLAQGLTELDLARQVRSAFFGAEAVRQQRGRDEVSTYVRLPLEERQSLYNVEQLVVRTPAGREMPVAEAAYVHRGQAYTVIHRADGRRSIGVTASLADKGATAGSIMTSIEQNELPRLLADVPGLDYRLGGELERQAKAISALLLGFAAALVVMFSILAVAFRSYLQPLLIMSAIPFGMIGAVWGHAAMGLELSLVSVMGLVALSGVVCNDSLILIDAINKNCEARMPLGHAVIQGCARRFRPVVLTSLTTFFGLMPMIAETSMQARFLVPMAVSLGFGILGATFIQLLIVPCSYVILEDLQRRVGRAFSAQRRATYEGDRMPAPG